AGRAAAGRATPLVPGARDAWVSVADAARRTGTSVSAVRGWARDGVVRSRAGQGPRGERTEVAVDDVERAAAERPVRTPAAPVAAPSSVARASRPRARDASRPGPVQQDAPGQQLVPLSTVEAMERLSGELYLAGQRAARAEAVAELRDRRLADLQQEVDDLQREATALWEQNQELVRRVAVAEAQVSAQPTTGPRWRLRR
ncbi:MAG: hypothetical protein JWN17_1258, partial [Frankiales bacterium]|nr:hypothetical protein [Frankiales bacterium]